MLAVTTMFSPGSFVMTASKASSQRSALGDVVSRLTVCRAVGVAHGGLGQHLYIWLAGRDRRNQCRGGTDIGEESSRKLHRY